MNNCIGLTKIFDIHMSVHPNIITNYRQQDATFLDLFIFKLKLSWPIALETLRNSPY